MTIKIATTDAEIERCIPAMLALRSHLAPAEAFDRIRSQQQTDGFVLAYV